MTSEKEHKIRILREAGNLFMKFGFKSITMDDVARELGISKKTLYQYFDDKNDLVLQTVQQHLDDQMLECQRIDALKTDPVSYVLEITDSVSDSRRQINAGVLYDMKKYFKPAWDKLMEFRTKFIFEQIQHNLELGKAKGYYHKDLHVKLIAGLYVHLVEFLMNPESYMHESVSFREVHIEMIKYHLRAICTEKGLKIFNEKIKDKK